MVKFMEMYQSPALNPVTKVQLRHHVIKAMTRSERKAVMSRDTDDEEHEQMMIRVITENNVKKLENALGKSKKHGKGFVLSSQLAKRNYKHSSAIQQRPGQPQMPIAVVGSTLGSPDNSRRATPVSVKRTPPPSRVRSAGSKKRKGKRMESPRPRSAYLTEPHYTPRPLMVDMGVQSNGPEELMLTAPPVTPEQTSECGERVVVEDENNSSNFIPDIKESSSSSEVETSESDPAMTKQLEQEGEGRQKRGKRISKEAFDKLNLQRRPRQFKYEATIPTICLKNPVNPEPLRSNVWVTMVPKSGSELKTPFYTQVDIPEGALRGDVIMKFETQSFDNAKLKLSPSDKLCSQIIDVNMSPLAYSLQQDAVVKMRVLEECVNNHDNVTIISSRHYNWRRIPTRIETKEVHGETHYYAVTNTQYLGKFAVITSQKLDRFVMTSAGGTFKSTISPNVTINLDERLIRDIPHLVELSVGAIRSEAIDVTSKKFTATRGVRGHLVASSHLVEVSKEIMGRSGLLDDGVTFPSNTNLTIPVEVCQHSEADKTKQHWKSPTVKIMKRSHEAVKEWQDGIGRHTNTFRLGKWEDITWKQTIKPDPITLQNGESVNIQASIPSQIMVLVFDDAGISRQLPHGEVPEIDQMCDALLSKNRIYEVALMVHQRVEQPEIISIHAVPVQAAEVIAKTIASDGEWKTVDNTLFHTVNMEEREYLDLRLPGRLRIAINQIEPKIQFHSRRWQGHQYQLEATDQAYNGSSEASICGVVEFLQISENDKKVVHSVNVGISRDRAKPYAPTVVTRPTPKVTVFREYKLAWMKNLTKAEQEKYKEINTP